jgi:hypothetical protein
MVADQQRTEMFPASLGQSIAVDNELQATLFSSVKKSFAVSLKRPKCIFFRARKTLGTLTEPYSLEIRQGCLLTTLLIARDGVSLSFLEYERILSIHAETIRSSADPARAAAKTDSVYSAA